MIDEQIEDYPPGPQKYLIMQSAYTSYSELKATLSEAVYLARKTKRVLVEPRITTLERFSEPKIAYGFVKEHSAMRDYYDLDGIQKDFPFKMITDKEYSDIHASNSSKIPRTLEIQFQMPASARTPGPPACDKNANYKSRFNPKFWNQYYRGFQDYMNATNSRLFLDYRVECYEYSGNSIPINAAIDDFRLNSDLDTIILTGILLVI